MRAININAALATPTLGRYRRKHQPRTPYLTWLKHNDHEEYLKEIERSEWAKVGVPGDNIYLGQGCMMRRRHKPNDERVREIPVDPNFL